MHILLAPDKFKGSLSATQVCQAIARGIHAYDSSITIQAHPLADGGDGSLELLASYMPLEKASVLTLDPLGRKLNASYLYRDNKAFIELASASGYVLLEKNEKNPLYTSSYGTGLMMNHALDHGRNEIYLFLGGSATNDAGTGILSALGFGFLDQYGNKLLGRGENLEFIRSIERPPHKKLDQLKLTLLCDVENPLYGKNGAAFVYAPQKGADTSAVMSLDKGLRNFAQVMIDAGCKDPQKLAGAGAAGGIPAGLHCLLGGQMRSGSENFIHLTDFEKHLKKADIVISGEGCIDDQSFQGKVVSAVSNFCAKQNKTLVLFAGTQKLSSGTSPEIKILCIDQLAESLDDSIRNADTYLEKLAFNWISKL